MKIKDLSLSDKALHQVARKVVGQTIIDDKIECRPHDFEKSLGSDLIIRIFFDKKPLNKVLNVKNEWGNNFRIDIIGLDEQGKKLSTKALSTLVEEGIREYVSVKNNNPYGMIDVDNFSGDY